MNKCHISIDKNRVPGVEGNTQNSVRGHSTA